ncbi:MAG TPA: hypothetical protein VFV33_04825 [Gemmatimonadaceae bacterium]|nr:hypothetical protein [Gemmatimonadaceae bacterium]
MTHRIYVLVSGWVLVGRVEDHPDSGDLPVRLVSGAVIRRWGATAGIGELAGGPLPGTVLDPLPTAVVIPQSAIVFALDVTGWSV